MARRKTPPLTEDRVAALGANRLARLILDHAGDDTRLRDTLKNLLTDTGGAPTKPSKGIASSVERRIQLLEDIDPNHDWRSAGALGADIGAIHRDIVEDLAPNHPRAAAILLARLIELQDTLFDMIDDSDGELGDSLFAVVDDWGCAWAAVDNRSMEEVVDIVFEAVENNPYGILDEVIAAFAEALGNAGLRALEARFQQETG